MLEEIGAAQHHDAITGTAKMHVAKDYSERLGKALAQGESIYKKELE